MYHSITFTIDSETFNTWTNWHLIPVKRPHVGPPEQEIMYQNELLYEPLNLELPGQFGVLRQRQASWQFAVYNDYNGYNWTTIYSNVLNALQGKIGTFVLEDDPGYFYRGRFHVSEWESGDSYSIITIEAECEPYKYSSRQTVTKVGRKFTFTANTDQETPCNLFIRIGVIVGTLSVVGLQRSKLTGEAYTGAFSIANVIAGREYQILGEARELTAKSISEDARWYIDDDVSNFIVFPTVVPGSNTVSVVGNNLTDSDVVIIVSYIPRTL